MNYKKFLTPLAQSTGAVLGLLLIVINIVRAVNDNVSLLAMAAITLLLFLLILVIKHCIELVAAKIKQDVPQPEVTPVEPTLQSSVDPATFTPTRLVIEVFMTRDLVSRRELIKTLNISRSDLRSALDHWQKTFLIVKRGKGRNTYYATNSLEKMMRSFKASKLKLITSSQF